MIYLLQGRVSFNIFFLSKSLKLFIEFSNYYLSISTPIKDIYSSDNFW